MLRIPARRVITGVAHVLASRDRTFEVPIGETMHILTTFAEKGTMDHDLAIAGLGIGACAVADPASVFELPYPGEHLLDHVLFGRHALVVNERMAALLECAVAVKPVIVHFAQFTATSRALATIDATR